MVWNLGPWLIDNSFLALKIPRSNIKLFTICFLKTSFLGKVA